MVKENKLTAFGAKVEDLELAQRDRLLDMDALFSSKRYSGALAAGIYALEILLKVHVCRTLRLDSLPKAFEIHDLDGLLILTGYHNLLNGERMRKSSVKRNWEEIRNVSSKLNDLRYQPDDMTTENQAKTFYYQLRDEKDGVIPWLLNPA